MGLIGSAIGAAGSIYGGIAASKAMGKVKKNLDNQLAENQDWYDRRYNEDATQRADAQRILTQTENSIKNRNRAAAGAQAVMGGTDESTAATKAANNQALAQATSDIAVNGENRKDAIESQYLQNKSDINGKLNNLQIRKANDIDQRVQELSNAAGGMEFGDVKVGKKTLDL